VYFPIFGSLADFRERSPNQVSGIRQDAIDAIAAMEPFKGGRNEKLWQLHALNIIDKHRSLITVGSAFRSFNIGAIMSGKIQKVWDEKFGAGQKLPEIEDYVKPADRLWPLKARDELFIDGPDSDLNPKVKFCFDVCLGEPGIIEGEPLVETLESLAAAVSAAIAELNPFLT
jgi:hypothetical protein